MIMITNKPIDGLLSVYGKNRLDTPSRVKSTSGVQSSKRDQLELSDTARVLQAANQALKNTAEIRMDKVKALRESIENGRYRVPATQIADAILREYESNLARD